MVLPQGKFESFLVAGSAEKEQILSTLFNVEKWRKIADWICKKASDIKAEGDKCNNNCNETLKRYDCVAREELTTLSEASEMRLSELEKELSDNEKLYHELTEEKEQLLIVNDNFIQLETLEKDFNQLQNQKDLYENLKQEISKNKIALEIEPYYDFCIQYNSQLKERRDYSDQMTVKLSDAETIAEEWQKKLDGMNALRGDIDSDKLRLQKLCDNRENVKALSQENQLLLTLDKNLSQGEAEINKHNEQLEKLKSLMSEAENQRKILSAQLSQLTQLSEKKKQLDDFAKLEKETQKISQQISSNRNEISQLEVKIGEEKIKLSDAENRREERYNHYITNLAAAISQTLSEGEPCPVCGSVHHPSPAKAPENAATEEEIRSLDSEIDKLRKAFSQLENDKKLLVSQNNQLQKDLSVKENELSQIAVFTAQEKEKLLSDYQNSMTAGEKLEEISGKLESLSNESLSVSESLESLKTEALEAEKQKASCLGKIQTISTELDKLAEEFSSDYVKLMEIEEEKSKITEEINSKYAQWDELSEM